MVTLSRTLPSSISLVRPWNETSTSSFRLEEQQISSALFTVLGEDISLNVLRLVDNISPLFLFWRADDTGSLTTLRTQVSTGAGVAIGADSSSEEGEP